MNKNFVLLLCVREEWLCFSDMSFVQTEATLVRRLRGKLVRRLRASCYANVTNSEATTWIPSSGLSFDSRRGKSKFSLFPISFRHVVSCGPSDAYWFNTLRLGTFLKKRRFFVATCDLSALHYEFYS